ncbi:MAG: tetratricopeptide repeat protein [Acutalibacteraceae bacterium]
MSYKENIANANTALGSGEFEIALKYSEKAISENPKESEGYYSAGKACMSMDLLDKAIEYFKKAVEIENKNGNGYFLLGYAYAMAGKTVEALQSLTEALENDCGEILKGQIYKIMSMINTDKGDFKNALLNIKQAEQYIGLDYELLQQKAACYASLEDYRKTLFTLNQMKLLNPNNYTAYSLAFHIFMDLGIYDEAKAELDRAEKFAELNMDYYNDKVFYALMNNPDKDTDENITEKQLTTIKEIDTALKKGRPNCEQTFEMYLRAAQLYISLENTNKALDCLFAAEDPVTSFNTQFSVLTDDNAENDVLSGFDDAILSPEEEEEILQEKWDNGEFEELDQKMEDAMYEIGDGDPEEITDAMNKYLSPLDAVPEKELKSEDYKLSEDFSMNQTQKDMMNALYLSAYEMNKDYDNMLHKARELQASDNKGTQYSGIYYELKVGKYKNDENWQTKYRDRINFWTKKMFEDPTDYISVAYRIRSYIDLGDFENAEQLCNCMPADMKEPLMKEINKAKSEGGGDNGNTSE